MKILFINLPYHGHVVPTIGLIQELIKQGCEVTYLMPFDWEEKVKESGAGFIGYDNHRLNLVYTLREYQPYEAEFSEEQYKFLGPSIYERTTDSFDFVKGTNAVVYILLGTVIKGARSFFQNCLEAFRDETMDVIIKLH